MIEIESYTVKQIIDHLITKVRYDHEEEITYTTARNIVLNALSTYNVNRAIDEEVKEYKREILGIID